MIYFFKRLPLAILTLFFVASAVFVLTKLAGEEAAFGEKTPSPEVRAAIEAKWGMDKPLIVQYWMHISKLMMFDSMESRLQKNKSLRDVLREQFPTSLRLGLRSILMAVLLGIPIGVFCAVYHNRLFDNVGKLFALVGVSVPSFIIASVLIVVFCTRWQLGGKEFGPAMGALNWDQPNSALIPRGLGGFPRAVLAELVRFKIWIPALALAAFPFAAVMRLTRSSMLDALSQDYIRTARAKGVSAWKVVAKHALRNALTPVVTFLGPITAGVVTGSIVVEKIFGIPGLGKFFVESVNNRDMPLIMGLAVFYSGILIGMNLLVDAIYPVLNPRLRK